MPAELYGGSNLGRPVRGPKDEGPVGRSAEGQHLLRVRGKRDADDFFGAELGIVEYPAPAVGLRVVDVHHPTIGAPLGHSDEPSIRRYRERRDFL